MTMTDEARELRPVQFFGDATEMLNAGGVTDFRPAVTKASGATIEHTFEGDGTEQGAPVEVPADQPGSGDQPQEAPAEENEPMMPVSEPEGEPAQPAVPEEVPGEPRPAADPDLHPEGEDPTGGTGDDAAVDGDDAAADAPQTDDGADAEPSASLPPDRPTTTKASKSRTSRK